MLRPGSVSRLALRRLPLTLRHGLLASTVKTTPSLLNRLSSPARNYAQKPPGGAPGDAGGFPGFNMFGQAQEKGDALKQYVRMHVSSIFWIFVLR